MCSINIMKIEPGCDKNVQVKCNWESYYTYHLGKVIYATFSIFMYIEMKATS